MSSSIVIALPKIEDAKKIRTILNRHGLTVASVCSSVSNALANISELDSAVLICGYKLTIIKTLSMTCHSILKCCFWLLSVL
mgnify:CR=1 FL=1